MKQKLCLLLAMLLMLAPLSALAESPLDKLLSKNQPKTNVKADSEESDILLQLVSIGEQPEFIIEEHAGGYWFAGYGSPEGNILENKTVYAKRTNIVPVTPGDQLAYKGNGSSAVSSVVWLEEDLNFYSDLKIQSVEGFTMVMAPDEAKYAWFQSFEYTDDPTDVVLEVEWIFCQEAEAKYQKSSYLTLSETYDYRIGELEKSLNELISIVTAMDQADPLYGKKIVYSGDDICSGVSGESIGYPQQIAEMTGGLFVSQTNGGKRLCENDKYDSIVSTLKDLPKDGDLYCFQAGINDYWAGTPVGECVPSNYKDALDPTTICGAMETIFRYCMDELPGKPVCFVITHKVQKSSYKTNDAGFTFTDYRNAMVEVCEKYAIPYYDAFLESGMPGWNETQNELFMVRKDGIHPNTEGYKHFYVPQLLDLFRRIMPVE